MRIFLLLIDDVLFVVIVSVLVLRFLQNFGTVLATLIMSPPNSPMHHGVITKVLQ